ncbi:diguanylate cyclase domain-containing protein [Gallaecimonas mangrovi]|uniref:diguanylate cyclase domain-containing protein n=1 Tax=Gallaecimonas mangrovi TaxID=2291597 RepID=UPI000E202309|nr:diguanylate cyclase [Gallaecimonas mangrovi]
MNSTLLQRLLTVALAYFLMGWLGLQVAQPPGYASPVWPAAGVALVAVLWWGPSMWLGVLVGSFLTNALIVGEPQALLDGNVRSWLVPLAIGIGASLQAVGGGWLLCFRRDWQLLDFKEILHFIVKGALVSTIIAASIGQLTLFLANINPSGTTAAGWLTWWTGDALGVALIAPLSLLWFNDAARNRIVWTAVIMLTLLTALQWSIQNMATNQRKQVVQELARQSDVASAALSAKAEHYLQSLFSLAQVFQASDFVSREEFHRVTDELLRDMPGLHALAWLPLVTQAQRANVEAVAGKELGRPYQFSIKNKAGQWVAAPNAQRYYPVLYMASQGEFPFPKGGLPEENPMLATAMNKASHQYKSVLAGLPSRFHYLDGKHQDFFAFRAVRDTQHQLMGYIMAVIDADFEVRVLTGVFNASSLEISALDNETGSYFLGPLANERGQRSGLWAERHVMVGERDWLLRFHYPEHFVLAQSNEGLWIVEVGGLLLVSLVGFTVLLVTGQTIVVGQEVLKRTQELEAANQQLGEREHFLNSLVENLPLSLAVKDASHLLYRRINTASEKLFGRSRQDIEGKDDFSLMDKNTARGLHRDDEAALNSAEPSLTSQECLQTPQGPRWFKTLRVPVIEDSLHNSFLLILREDITERLQSEAREQELTVALSERNQELAAANDRLEALSRIDGLTQLFNRRTFDEELHKEWLRCARHQQPLTLMMLDVDFFKRFNDAAGHLAGDRCLQQLAGILHDVVKRSGEIAARFGGEEFAIILPGSDLDQARTMAISIQEALAKAAITHPDSPIDKLVTVSIGIASGAPHQIGEPQQLLDLADKALYRAKHQGRNRFEASSYVS